MTDYSYEKLGLFYLGKELDIESGKQSVQPLLYKSKNLTTHAVMIGMTGSGKTGLGIGLIEEAMMDNIPSIIIDPKGDMGNLLLTFPELKAEDFAPWLDPADAARKELSIDDYAKKTATDWQEGLAGWGQSRERVAQLNQKTERVIYTPGSSAGVQVSVLASFDAPPAEMLADTDTLNGLVNSTVTSLLTLIDVEGDPLSSREHILLSSILLDGWRKGDNLTMEKLIGAIVSPPFEKIGVFALETFYPQSDRMKLAMSMNNILASPTFSAWTRGEPLDIQRILYTEEGNPRTAIFSIAHLSETERMFFVTMLLNRFIGWMRRQQGTSSLKALLYMDEIFGYFPPTANPPSKKPMLLLLKQARAFGVGVVLATQNPVDLDYKGLSNIGTWFVGRLQTRQDQEKVVEGITGASDGKLDVGTVKKLLSNMKGRQFLLNSTHLDEPLLFATRWVMSYLKGPVSISEIKKLMGLRERTGGGQIESVKEELTARPGGRLAGSSQPPVLAKGIEQLYFMQNIPLESVMLEPWLAASAKVRFYNSSRNIDEEIEVSCRIYLDEDVDDMDWESGEVLAYPLDECTSSRPDSAEYYPLPASFSSLRSLASYKKSYSDFLYQTERLELFRIKSLKIESRPGESMGDFRIRANDLLKEKKDEAVEKLRRKYATKEKQLGKKIDRAMDKVDKEKVDVKTRTGDTIISFGLAAMGALFGRKTFSSTNANKAARGMRNVGRVAKEKQDVARAEENLAQLQVELEQLGAEIELRVEELSEEYSPDNYEPEIFSIKPRRSDIFNVEACLLWEMNGSIDEVGK